MSQTEQPGAAPSGAPPVVVKKYANRRLYNTESSSYITLDNLADMIRAGRDFVVYDAKSGEDITRSVLTQIIVEEESKGRALLPTTFLRQLIGFYGDSLQNLVPRYLEQAMANFARQQQQMRTALQQTMGNFFPFGMEEVGRQNMAMMERAMNLFSPFYRPPGQEPPRESEPGAPPAPNVELEAELFRLRAEVQRLRAELQSARAQPAPAAPPPAGPRPAAPPPAAPPPPVPAAEGGAAKPAGVESSPEGAERPKRGSARPKGTGTPGG